MTPWDDYSRWEQVHHFRATLDARDRLLANPEMMEMVRQKLAELEARRG